MCGVSSRIKWQRPNNMNELQQLCRVSFFFFLIWEKDEQKRGSMQRNHTHSHVSSENLPLCCRPFCITNPTEKLSRWIWLWKYGAAVGRSTGQLQLTDALRDVFSASWSCSKTEAMQTSHHWLHLWSWMHISSKLHLVLSQQYHYCYPNWAV